ncbi:hypothetical protein [Thermaurantiacus sp.]
MAPASDLLEAWLAVVARDGWSGATIALTAAQAGRPETEVAESLGDSFDALRAFLDSVATAAAAAAAAASGTVRDRLFDGLMAGFDILARHRAAVEALVSSSDPLVYALAASRAGPAMRRLASAAGVDITGLAGPARVAALLGLAARVFHAWRRDDSPDMAATMAELDRLLARAADVAESGLVALIRRLFPAVPGRRDQGRGQARDPAAE